MTLGQYDPELIFCVTSQQMAMLASKLVSDRILDILTSIYINISTFKGVCPSIYVLQTWSMSAYWDFENRKSTKGSPLWNEKKILSPISLKFYVWDPLTIRILNFGLFSKKFKFPKNFNVKNFKLENVRSGFTGSWQISKGKKSCILVNLALIMWYSLRPKLSTKSYFMKQSVNF